MMGRCGGRASSPESRGMASSQTRILRILTRLNIGGPAIHASLLSRKLPASRYATLLVVGQPERREGDMANLLGDAPADVIKIPSLRRPIRPLSDVITLIRLLRIVRRYRPRIIHTHMAKAGSLGRLAGILYNRFGRGRKPGQRAILIHTFHGHVLDGYFSSWTSRLFLRIERWLAARTDCLIAVSPAVRRDLLALGIGRARQWRVVPLGLELSDLSRLDAPAPRGTIHLGMVGRLVPIKNVSLFLESLQRLATRTREPFSAAIVGDGPLRAELEREVARRSLAPRVRFTGWQRDLPAVYRELDIVCLTSLNEGTPVALIEAMATGRPVVATAVGGVVDLLADGLDASHIPAGDYVITDRGLIVRPGDAEGFTRALERLLGDTDLRERLGQAARAFVLERFSSDRLIRDIDHLYQEVLSGEPHRPASTFAPTHEVSCAS